MRSAFYSLALFVTPALIARADITIYAPLDPSRSHSSAGTADRYAVGWMAKDNPPDLGTQIEWRAWNGYEPARRATSALVRWPAISPAVATGWNGQTGGPLELAVQFWSVESPWQELAVERSTPGPTNVFDDLGEGTSYGSVTIPTKYNLGVTHWRLGAAALEAINAAADAGERFAIGYSVPFSADYLDDPRYSPYHPKRAFLALDHGQLILDPPESELFGDLNADGRFDNLDIDPFALALANRAAYDAAFPAGDALWFGDMNFDGRLDNRDIDPFAGALAAGAQAVPEPAAWLLAIFAGLSGGLHSWRRFR